LLNALDGLIPKWKFSHIPTSGVKVTATTKKGTYLVGSFGSDLEFILKELDYPTITDYQKLRRDYGFLLPKGQKFNLLNVSEAVVEYFSKKGGFFNRVNTKWIDAAVKRGDDIILISSKNRIYKKIQLKGNNIKYELTGYGKEIHRLEWKYGYRYDIKTNKMLPLKKENNSKTLTKFNDNKIN